MPFEDKEGCLNINVHEPRNAEFTAFLGSFLVAWQSNDNNFGNYSMYTNNTNGELISLETSSMIRSMFRINSSFISSDNVS